jgi:signal transduction histidine kinase
MKKSYKGPAMESPVLNTHFAPARRESPELLRAQHELFIRGDIASALDALPVMVLILNTRRQVVLANAKTLQATGLTQAALLGQRPGEVFGCVHADEEPGGCGSTRFCAKCGAVRSILAGIEGFRNMEECGLLRQGAEGVEALDLMVSSSPVEVSGQRFVIFTIMDISDAKRRRNLERLFFHDILNTAGGLSGLMEFLSEDVPEHLRHDAEFIQTSLARLVEELTSQKDLLAAESNELRPVFTALDTGDAVAAAVRLGARQALAEGKTIETAPSCPDVEFTSDAALLGRVLGNMVKNALEACPKGGVVRVWCDSDGGNVSFHVRNPTAMDEEARLRVFTRNYSTKGAGRGLGTYGMRLLGERYLGGSVSFTSSEEAGTVFTLTLPMAGPQSGASGQP